MLDSYLNGGDAEARQMGLELLLEYGTSIIMQTYQQGQRTQRLDILPCLRVQVPGWAEFGVQEWEDLDDEDSLCLTEPAGLLAKEQARELLLGLDTTLVGRSHVRIAWDALSIEPLTTPLLQLHERADMYDNYRQANVRTNSGLYETELGYYRRQPDWTNLWNVEAWNDEEDWDAVDEQRHHQYLQAQAAEEQHQQQEWQGTLDAFNDRLQKVETMAQAGQFTAAIQLADEVLAEAQHRLIFFNESTLLNNRAYYYYRAGQPDTALRHLENLLRQHPDYALAHHTKAEVLAALGDYPQALASIDQAIQLAPDAEKKAYRQEILRTLQK